MATVTPLKMKQSTTKTMQASTITEKPGLVRAWLPRLLVPLGSSLLLWMCYFPLSWGFLAWVALVPLLALVRQDRSTKAFFWLSFLAGFAFYVPVLQWLRVADWRMSIAWLLLATYCAFYFPVAMLLIRRLDRGKTAPLWLSVPLAWVGMEYIRSFLLSGFAWYFLGHSQHRYLPVIQIADLGGVYLVSVLIAACNGLLMEGLYRWPAFRRTFKQQEPEISPRWEYGNWAPVALGMLVVTLGLIATLVYGSQRLAEDDFLPGPRIALLQGNIDQRLRNQAMDPEHAVDVGLSIAEHYRRLYPLAYDLTRDPARRKKDRMPDLVIWPETSFPAYWAETNPNVPIDKMPPEYKTLASEIPILMAMLTDPRGMLSNIQRDEKGKIIKDPDRPLIYYTCPTNHLIGMNGALLNDDAEMVHYNLAVLIDKKGKKLERYEKVHPVPFGEYIPFRKTLPFMTMFSPYGKDWPGIEAGTRLTRFTLQTPSYLSKEPFPFRFGVLICYEDTDPRLARQYGRNHEDGPPVDFLVNMSNDGWFDGTCEHEEHLAISRFRAVETRRAVLRSVNMGISAVIDGNGRVQKPLEFEHRMKTEMGKPMDAKLWAIQEIDGKVRELPVSEWSEFKKVDGVIHATVPIDRRTSLYSQWGDWVPGLCWGIIALFLVLPVIRGMRRGLPLPGLPHASKV